MSDIRSSEVLKRGFRELFKGTVWLKTLGAFSIPMLFFGVLIAFGPITSFLSLILLPFAVPFFYNALRYVWSRADTDGEKFSLQPSNYLGHTGARGSLGFLTPSILGIIVYEILLIILIRSAIPSLLGTFGYPELAVQFEAAITGGDVAAFNNFTREHSRELSGPLMVIYGSCVYLLLILMVLLLENNRFSFVLMNRVLPDADNNLIGTQTRALGKQFGMGLYWKRIGLKGAVFIPSLLILTAIYAGALTGFCFIETSRPQLMGGIPALITVPFALLWLVVDSSLDVPLADALMSDVVKKCDARQISSVRNTFRNPEYTHTPSRAGQVVFQGKDTGIAASQFDSPFDFYRASDWDDPSVVDPPRPREEGEEKTYDASTQSYEKENSTFSRDTSSTESTSSEGDDSYGIFHFGDDNSSDQS